MALPTLFLSSTFVSTSHHKLLLPHHQHHHCWSPLRCPPRGHFTFTISASSANKSSRSSRKVKSNEELYNDITEFLSAVGLPKFHVPSMKELSQHGRSDLANIVRRRGYKVVRQLLESSAERDFDAYGAEKSLAGQDGKVNIEVEHVSSSVEVPSVRDCFGSANTDQNLNSDDYNCMHIESSANSMLPKGESYNLNSQDQNMPNVVEEMSLFKNVSVMNNHSSGSYGSRDPNSDSYIFPPTESSSNPSLGETVLPNVNGQCEKAGNITDTASLSADMCITENNSCSSNFNSSLNSEEHGYTSLQSSANETLEEKVATFIQNGDLDIMDHNVYDILYESEEVMELHNRKEVKSRTSGVEHLEHITVTNGAMSLNASALSSKQIGTSGTADHPFSDDYSGAGLRGSNFDNLDFEARGRENQGEINHLQLMLHQKEKELSCLKEQIEKEKFALSILQTKAETEINKAQKLICDKDAELLAAEESLAGLEEVEIQYSGDGEIVEVAGSFNGWHHRIKMDPQPSSSIVNPSGSRKSRHWSTMLWLYPGIYEIKFIVDGQWKIDPQRESVTRGVFCNNILRVNR